MTSPWNDPPPISEGFQAEVQRRIGLRRQRRRLAAMAAIVLMSAGGIAGAVLATANPTRHSSLQTAADNGTSSAGTVATSIAPDGSSSTTSVSVVPAPTTTAPAANTTTTRPDAPTSTTMPCPSGSVHASYDLHATPIPGSNNQRWKLSATGHITNDTTAPVTAQIYLFVLAKFAGGDSQGDPAYLDQVPEFVTIHPGTTADVDITGEPWSAPAPDGADVVSDGEPQVDAGGLKVDWTSNPSGCSAPASDTTYPIVPHGSYGPSS